MEEEDCEGQEWHQERSLPSTLRESMGIDGIGDDLPLLQAARSLRFD